MRAVIAAGPQRLHGSVAAQPSKNYTTRYLLAGALAHGLSIVRNAAVSEDSEAMQRAITRLGASVEWRGPDLYVNGFGGKPHLSNPDPINVGNAGAVLRLVLSVGALLPQVTFVTDRPDSLGRRPNADLIHALSQLGCRSESHGGYLPITLLGGNLHGGDVEISGSNSSQYLSGILFLAPLIAQPIHIRVTGGLVSRAPVRQTLEVLDQAGVHIRAADDLQTFHVRPLAYRAGNFYVNGDWPGSAALLAAAAATGSQISVRGLFDDSQGEKACVDVLRAMGASIDIEGAQARTITVHSGSQLHGVVFDGDLATDAVLALMAAAALASGRTRFHNVSNLRLKECDRITEPIVELRSIGVHCWEGKELNDPDPDAIIIEGNPEGYEGGIVVDGRKDHRVIMMLSIIGLCCRKGLTIAGAEHIAKSYPGFFDHLQALGARLNLEGNKLCDSSGAVSTIK